MEKKDILLAILGGLLIIAFVLIASFSFANVFENIVIGYKVCKDK